MIRTWKQKQFVKQSKLMARLKREQDLKNNINFENRFFKPATNQTALELGYSLRLTKLGHRTT
tara:strand:- start:840 stop:1028 length:189 start_codon:yes stop_codon:yes gene_type:complete